LPQKNTKETQKIFRKEKETKGSGEQEQAADFFHTKARRHEGVLRRAQKSGGSAGELRVFAILSEKLRV
jgi:hypothetical protein